MGSRNTTCASVTLWVLTVYGMPHLQPNKIIRGAPPPLEHGLEEILVGSVAAATVAQPQDRGGLGITSFANTVPIPAKALTGKLARVVRQATVDRPTVAHPIVNTVRNEHAVGPTGKIMIEGMKRLSTTHSTGPKELTQMLFRFGVNRKTGITSYFVLSDQTGDPLEWRIAVR